MILPAVISRPESANPRKVDRLVEFCRKLDGTEIKVIPISKQQDADFIASHPHNTFFQLQAYALRLEAQAMMRQAFVHLEPDSIPLQPGWLQAISDEYARRGKSYLWATDSHPPGDLCGGIGVYGPDTAIEIPHGFDHGSWDGWMLQHMNDRIARTPLIQHKYGIYEGRNKTRDIVFPRDNSLLRPEAVLFHRDPTQSLMREPGPMRFAHSGCIGDTIAALPAIRQLGGGELIMTQKGNKRIMRGERYESLRCLLDAQPYIHGVKWEEEPEGIDYDFTDFRYIYQSHVSLAETQAKYIGVEKLDMSPWLNAPANPATKGRIVVARSARYRNGDFPWNRLATLFGDKMTFIGLPEEHADFQGTVHRLIPRLPCASMLDIASAIKGATLFIGNQSSPFWIAAGLGQNLIQEVYAPNPDSIVPRSNATYQRGHMFHPSFIRSFLEK